MELKRLIVESAFPVTESEAHISDKVAAILKTDGWKEGKGGKTFTKKIKGYEASGTVSDGTRAVTLEFDDRYRYLSRVDGWGKTIKDVDLRSYEDRPDQAIKDVLKNK